MLLFNQGTKIIQVWVNKSPILVFYKKPMINRYYFNPLFSKSASGLGSAPRKLR